MESLTESSACALEPLSTSHHWAEKVREASDEMFPILADALPQIVWTARPDGWRDYFNRQWYEHTALRLVDAHGDGWSRALHADDREGCLAAWRDAAEQAESFELEYRLLCAEDGTYRWHLERALPLLDPYGVRVRWFGTCTDIDDRKRTEERVAELNQRLQRAMTETHHRVKNNLQIISAMVDIQLLNGTQSISASEFRRLGSHVRTLAAVHDILTADAKALGEAELHSASDILRTLLPTFEESSPQCTVLAHLEEVMLPGRQATSLALVVNELVSNAVKHGRGQIEMSMVTQGSSVVVEVCDDGPGFEPGFDVKESANTGLDLVESLGRWDLAGTVVYENRPDGGARVRLVIPLPRTPDLPA